MSLSYGGQGMSEPGTLISKGKLEVADVSALQLPQRNRRAWLHAGFCVVSLPHSKPKDARDDHVVDGDGYKLILQPKPIDVDTDGNTIYTGLPYGAKARIILMHLQTQAIRNKSPVVSLGENMTSFIRRLGYENVNGGERGVIAAVQEQAVRIGRTNFTLIDKRAARGISTVRDAALADGLDLFQEGPDDGQLSLFNPDSDDKVDKGNRKKGRRYTWVKQITLSDQFYEHLLTNKVELTEEVIAALKGSSWALDVYLWLAYTLPGLETTLELSWAELHRQFAPKLYVGNLPALKKKILTPALEEVRAACPAADFGWGPEGVTLRPSRMLAAGSRPIQSLISNQSVR
jgi:hypothetical protein